MGIFQPFDATTVDPTQGGGKFPVGRHLVVATANEILPTKDNSGGMLVYTLKIIDGTYKDTEAPYRLNLYNNSQKAVEIAFKQLSALCYVTGKLRIMDPSELHNVPFFIEVGLQDASKPDGYTEIKKVFDQNGVAPGQSAPAAAAPAPAPAANAAPQGGWAAPQGQPAQPAQAAAPAGWGAPSGQQPNPAFTNGSGHVNGATQQAAPWGAR